MIILTETTDKIQVVLSNAVTTNQLQCTASYRDSGDFTFSPGRNAVNTNNTTAVDLVTSPTAGISRGIDYLSVLNIDTVSAIVTVRVVINSTNYTLWKGVLNTGDKVEYTDSLGFVVKNALSSNRTFTAEYNPDNIITQSIGNRYVSVLNTDFNIVSDTQFQINKGLGFPVVSGTEYFFEFFIRYQTNATTTGTAHTVTGPPTSYLMYDTKYSLAATTVTTNANLVAFGGGVVNTDTVNTPNARAVIRGVCIPSANGFIWSEVNSEANLANTVIIKAGSFVEWLPITQI